MKETWIKVVEYASKPHAGLSRKLRKGFSFSVNCGEAMEGEVVFEIYDTYLRVTTTAAGKETNAYYDWDKIASIETANAV